MSVCVIASVFHNRRASASVRPCLLACVCDPSNQMLRRSRGRRSKGSCLNEGWAIWHRLRYIVRKCPQGKNQSSRDNNDELRLMTYSRAQRTWCWQPCVRVVPSTVEGEADIVELVAKCSKVTGSRSLCLSFIHAVFSPAIFPSIPSGAHVVRELLLP